MATEEVKIELEETKEDVVVEEEKPTTEEEDQKEDTQAQEETQKETSEEEEAEDEATKTLNEALETEKEVIKSLADKGLDFEKCAEEYEANGSLSEETYKKLAEAGYTKAVVDAYIAGVEAKATKITNTILEKVGGEAEYNKLAKFIQAKGNAAVDAYNALVDSGNLSALVMFLNGVKAEMTLTKGTANRTVLGGQGNNAVKGFETEADMVKAMTDPRYKTDPDYAKKVAMKLEKSSFVKYGR